jgi:uncharacterized membrane-anchored protein
MKEIIGVSGFFSILCVMIFIITKVAQSQEQSMIIVGLIFLVVCIWLLIKFVKMFMENVDSEPIPSDWLSLS